MVQHVVALIWGFLAESSSIRNGTMLYIWGSMDLKSDVNPLMTPKTKINKISTYTFLPMKALIANIFQVRVWGYWILLSGIYLKWNAHMNRNGCLHDISSKVFAALDLMVILVISLFFSKTSAWSLSLLNFSKSSYFSLHCSNMKGRTLLPLS